MFNAITSFFQSLHKQVQAEIQKLKIFSWHTLIFLSLFSWLVSLAVSTRAAEEIIARMGWLFLTLGIGWGMEKVEWKIFDFKIYPGAWIAGALLCIFLFQGLLSGAQLLILWPLISAILTLTPKFFKNKFDVIDPRVEDPKKFAGDRQEIVMLILVSSLLSCWFQFSFLINDWLDRYPSMGVGNFGRSAFVSPITVGGATPVSGGVGMLNTAELVMREKFATLSWADVQQWLARIEMEMPALEDQVRTRLAGTQLEESNLWRMQAQVLPGQPDYTVRFRAFWGGPSVQSGGFYAEKVCLITQAPVSNATQQGSTQVVCQPATDQHWIQQP